MPLIDEIGPSNNQPKDNTRQCVDCKKNLPSELDVNICESCFNQKVENTLVEIKKNITYIKIKIAEVTNTINKINFDLTNKNLHIVYANRYRIDLLNFDALHRKLLIDLETNIKGYELNQIQANDFRKVNH